MPVVTLTTDFGQKDYYVAVIKGALLQRDERLNLIDITHQVNNYDIVQAAFLFKQAWPCFPAGSIHLISVNDLYSPDHRFLLVREGGHYFIGPDNGLFSLIFDPLPEDIVVLPFPEKDRFPLSTVFAEAVAQLLEGKPWNELGTPAGEIVRRITFQPVIGPARIRGSVIHIDNYENAIVNISRELFEQVGCQRPFSLFFKRHDPITKISHHYYEVPVGETLCWFNSADLMEISINMGKASSLLGLQVEDTVQVDFHETGQEREF